MNEILHLGWWICGSRVGCCCCLSGPRTAAACSPPHHSPRLFFFFSIRLKTSVDVAHPAGHFTAKQKASKWISFLCLPFLLPFFPEEWWAVTNQKTLNPNEKHKTKPTKQLIQSYIYYRYYWPLRYRRNIFIPVSLQKTGRLGREENQTQVKI